MMFNYIKVFLKFQKFLVSSNMAILIALSLFPDSVNADKFSGFTSGNAQWFIVSARSSGFLSLTGGEEIEFSLMGIEFPRKLYLKKIGINARKWKILYDNRVVWCLAYQDYGVETLSSNGVQYVLHVGECTKDEIGLKEFIFDVPSFPFLNLAKSKDYEEVKRQKKKYLTDIYEQNLVEFLENLYSNIRFLNYDSVLRQTEKLVDSVSLEGNECEVANGSKFTQSNDHFWACWIEVDNQDQPLRVMELGTSQCSAALNTLKGCKKQFPDITNTSLGFYHKWQMTSTPFFGIRYMEQIKIPSIDEELIQPCGTGKITVKQNITTKSLIKCRQISFQ